MKIRTMGLLAAGTAIGYALNTESGRKMLAQVKEVGGRFLGRPEVQARTADLADMAKHRTGSLPDPVQKVANETIDIARKAASRPAHSGEDGSPDAP